MILNCFREHLDSRSIGDLYGTIVAQARSASFYTDYGVPDTVLGRFDLIVLHLVLVLARLDADGDSARGTGQSLFDLFCRDLDANLREMGVGDLAVPKRMRCFGEAFYGRQAAYLAALQASNAQDELEKALARNIFQEVNGDGPRRLARYMLAVSREFETRDFDGFWRRAVAFPKPEAIPHA
jgi:cytochrome b pre-mRNA-processing protein 3